MKYIFILYVAAASHDAWPAQLVHDDQPNACEISRSNKCQPVICHVIAVRLPTDESRTDLRTDNSVSKMAVVMTCFYDMCIGQLPSWIGRKDDWEAILLVGKWRFYVLGSLV